MEEVAVDASALVSSLLAGQGRVVASLGDEERANAHGLVARLLRGEITPILSAPRLRASLSWTGNALSRLRRESRVRFANDMPPTPRSTVSEFKSSAIGPTQASIANLAEAIAAESIGHKTMSTPSSSTEWDDDDDGPCLPETARPLSPGNTFVDSPFSARVSPLSIPLGTGEQLGSGPWMRTASARCHSPLAEDVDLDGPDSPSAAFAVRLAAAPLPPRHFAWPSSSEAGRQARRPRRTSMSSDSTAGSSPEDSPGMEVASAQSHRALSPLSIAPATGESLVGPTRLVKTQAALAPSHVKLENTMAREGAREEAREGAREGAREEAREEARVASRRDGGFFVASSPSDISEGSPERHDVTANPAHRPPFRQLGILDLVSRNTVSGGACAANGDNRGHNTGHNTGRTEGGSAATTSLRAEEAAALAWALKRESKASHAIVAADAAAEDKDAIEDSDDDDDDDDAGGGGGGGAHAQAATQAAAQAAAALPAGGVLLQSSRWSAEAVIVALIATERASFHAAALRTTPRTLAPSQRTLVVCAARRLDEVEDLLVRAKLPVVRYEGSASRRRQALHSASCAVVLASWGVLAAKEVRAPIEATEGVPDGAHDGAGWTVRQGALSAAQREKRSLLHSVHWRRLVLLDAQSGANASTQRAQAALALKAGCRWAVTAPPASAAARRRRVPHEPLLSLIGLSGPRARTALAASLVRGFPGADEREAPAGAWRAVAGARRMGAGRCVTTLGGARPRSNHADGEEEAVDEEVEDEEVDEVEDDDDLFSE